MFYGIKVESLTFNDGSTLEPKGNSTITLTGPNNCGKSQTIKEISFYNKLQNKSNSVIIDSYKPYLVGNMDDVLLDILKNPIIIGNEDYVKSHFYGPAQRDMIQFLEMMARSPHVYDACISALLNYMPTARRLSGIQTVFPEQTHLQLQQIPRALKQVYENNDLENKLYDLVASHFGKGILINRSSFLDYKLHFIDRAEANSRPDKGKSSYAEWFQQQSLLDHQGDGIRAFSTIVFSLLTNPKPLVLIDEPEAFLHPPQVRSPAKIIAQETSNDSQLIIATHSDEFLRGMIEFGSER